MSSDPQVLDVEGVMQRMDGDREFLRELVDMFFSDFPAQTIALKRAVTEKNFEHLQRDAHSMKSALGNLGAMRAHRAAQGLEYAARDKKGQEIAARLNEFCEAAEAFRVAVYGFLNH